MLHQCSVGKNKLEPRKKIMVAVFFCFIIGGK